MASFGFLSSLFSFYLRDKKSTNNNNIQDEFNVLMDAAILSMPNLLKEGFKLSCKSKISDFMKSEEMIFHLNELDLNTCYHTSNDTKVIRSTQFEVTVGYNIIIPILKPGETYETTRNKRQYCMKGQLYPESLLVAIENFYGQSIRESGLLFYQNGNSRQVFITENFKNLEPNITYVTPNGGIVIRRLINSKRVEFSFGRNLHPITLPDRKIFIKDPNDSVSPKQRGTKRNCLLHSISNTNTPVSPRIVTRIGLKKRNFNELDIPKQKLFENVPKRQKIDNDDNAETRSISSPKAELDKIPVLSSPLESVPAPPPPPIRHQPPPPPPPARNSNLSANTVRRRRIRPLHWKAIPRNKVQSTFWSTLENIALNSNDQESETQDLENEVTGVFSLSPDKKPTVTMGKTVTKQRVHLLDVKKSNNISILLSQFKISYSEIKEAIITMDPILTTEQLISLKYMFPLTDEEKSLIEEYHGNIDSLSCADQFYVELLPVPRLEQKINFLLFKNQFNEQIETMLETASILSNAAAELQTSQQFGKILKWIFTIGSLLNKETRMSEAGGFSLDSLPKIIETKTGKGNQSFIDFLVTKVEKKNPEIMHFEEELPNLEQASKVSLDILQSHKKETEMEVQDLRREIQIYKQSVGIFSEDDRFLEVMKPFLEYAEKKIAEVSETIIAAITIYNSTVEFFGDDPKTTTPTLFFTSVVTFAHSFRRSYHLYLEKKQPQRQRKEKENTQLFF